MLSLRRWSAGWVTLAVISFCAHCTSVAGLSSDSSLSDFVVNCDASSNSRIFSSVPCELSPAFNSSVIKYYISPSDHIQVTPTASDSAATITIEGVATVSGEASAWLETAVGTKTWFQCIVKAEDGTTTTYYFSSGSNYDRPWLSLGWMLVCFVILRLFLALNQLVRYFRRKVTLGSWGSGGKH